MLEEGLMAKMSPGAKATRVLTFLLGLRDTRVSADMARHGFGEAELDEGWALLRALGKVKTDSGGVASDRSSLDELAAWEKRWFPVASAALERGSPAIHTRLFANLARADGAAVMVVVPALLDRLDAMAAGRWGPEGSAVRARCSRSAASPPA